MLQDFDDLNKGIVNSEMYKRQALHFSNKKKFEEAKKYLTLGNILLHRTNTKTVFASSLHGPQ